MSIPGEVGKIATSTIDALRGQPGLLALILLQVTTLGVLYFVNDRQNERRQAREMMLMEKCLPDHVKE